MIRADRRIAVFRSFQSRLPNAVFLHSGQDARCNPLIYWWLRNIMKSWFCVIRKEALFGTKTRLLLSMNKASLHSKQGFFEKRGFRFAPLPRNCWKKRILIAGKNHAMRILFKISVYRLSSCHLLQFLEESEHHQCTDETEGNEYSPVVHQRNLVPQHWRNWAQVVADSCGNKPSTHHQSLVLWRSNLGHERDTHRR